MVTRVVFTAHPRSPASWLPAWGPPPAYSHTDGEPLCPGMGAHGYQPADPVHLDGTAVERRPGRERAR